jgi:hypothetical protein
MALLLFDGFDHYGNGQTVIHANGKWVSGAGSSSNNRNRTGGFALGISTLDTVTTKVLPASGGCIVGLAFNYPGIPNNSQDFIQIREGATTHMILTFNNSGQLQVKRGATILATGTTIYPANSWFHLQFKAIIDDVNGSYETRVDGVVEPLLTNVGPVDTRNGGATGQWDRILLNYLLTGAQFNYIDDFFVLDTSGAAPRNNFLGTAKVETLMPQTDAVAAGSNAGLTPSTGTDHGALVDEVGPNTTDYNSSPTVGLKDTYQYPPMTLTGTIFGVQTNMYISKSDATVRQVCPVVRTASVDTDGPNVSPTTTFGYFTRMWEQDPNAGAPIEWTTGSIATLQAGMKVTV